MNMNMIFFMISMLAFGTAFVIFISMVLNDGVKGLLDLSRKPVKWMSGAFALYLVTFAAFILLS
ncbi:Mas-related G-protein coupled receptor member D [Bacillus swezeyi]|nr:Mas-related G-protein coupled receptor member D [Bacillus swezeyi]